MVASCVNLDLHDIARRVAKAAGADFAFVLSQAGLLVTKDAPRDMPDRGRMKILWACPAGKNNEVVHIELPRDDLVPFGGAAPVDAFAMRVEDTAILVAIVPTWHDKSNVVLAITEGATQIAAMIRAARRVRTQKGAVKKAPEPKRERPAAAPTEGRRERTTIPFEPMRAGPQLPPEPSGRSDREAPGARRERTTIPFEPARRTSVAPVASGKRERPSVLPPAGAKRERSSALPKAPREAAVKKAPRKAGARGSSPEIEIGEAEVGRETMLALEPFRPRRSSEPEIEVGVTEAGRETMAIIDAHRPRGRSEPDIILGEAEVGRETLVAIDAALPRPKPGPAPEGVRIQIDSISRESLLEVQLLEAAQRGRPTVDEPLVTERRTLPWVDSPEALKRTVEAREIARAAAPPDVKVRVEEVDPEALGRSAREGKKR